MLYAARLPSCGQDYNHVKKCYLMLTVPQELLKRQQKITGTAKDHLKL